MQKPIQASGRALAMFVLMWLFSRWMLPLAALGLAMGLVLLVTALVAEPGAGLASAVASIVALRYYGVSGVSLAISLVLMRIGLSRLPHHPYLLAAVIIALVSGAMAVLVQHWVTQPTIRREREQ